MAIFYTKCHLDSRVIRKDLFYADKSDTVRNGAGRIAMLGMALGHNGCARRERASGHAGSRSAQSRTRVNEGTATFQVMTDRSRQASHPGCCPDPQHRRRGKPIAGHQAICKTMAQPSGSPNPLEGHSDRTHSHSRRHALIPRWAKATFTITGNDDDQLSAQLGEPDLAMAQRRSQLPGHWFDQGRGTS